MTFLDDLWWSKVTFDVTVQSTDGDFDLVEISNLGNSADVGPPYRGALVEFGALELHVADETTLTANEHLGMSIRKLWDTDPDHVNHGDQSGLNDIQVEQGIPREWLGYYATNHGNNVNIYAGSGTVAVGNTTPVNRAVWHGGFNVQTGFEKIWLPKDRPIVNLGMPNGYTYRQAAVWRLDQAPSSDLRLKGYLTFRTVSISFD
jgi:hypothetical protein